MEVAYTAPSQKDDLATENVTPHERSSVPPLSSVVLHQGILRARKEIQPALDAYICVYLFRNIGLYINM